MKKILCSVIVSIIAALAFAAILSAQEPSFRTPGYKGMVSYTNRLLIMSGIETSHGYMFNPHHYLGAGAGVFFLPERATKIYSDVFLDYHVYIADRKSTPVVGVKAGYLFNCNTPTGEYQDKNGLWLYYRVDGFTYNKDAVYIEPGAGWSWLVSSRFGVTAGLHADIYLYKNPDVKAVVLPKLSLGIEF